MSEEELLRLGMFDFKDPRGFSFADRSAPFVEWVDGSSRAGLFQFLRHHESAPQRCSSVIDWGGQRYLGLNFASQDYLGLARNPLVIDAASHSCREHGTHSAGSEPMGGGLAEGKILAQSLASFVEHEHVVLFPTGWGAGYGAIKALVRPYDFVILDALSHDCLQHGARASAARIAYFAHNNMESLRKRLHIIRSQHPESAILVVTESLFSMDSDHADMGDFVSICKAFHAYTMVDVAHDLGVLGPAGKGVLAEAGILREVDFLVGSFSKVFACIGGFFASKEKGTSYFVRAFSGSYTFSNWLIPPQVAAINKALEIVREESAQTEGSPKNGNTISWGNGGDLRKQVLANASLLRGILIDSGLCLLGRLSPLVIPIIGEESVARRTYRRCMERGLILNNIEFPACRRGAARFRLQLTPDHSVSDVEKAASILIGAIREEV